MRLRRTHHKIGFLIQSGFQAEINFTLGGARVEDGASVAGPCFIDDGAVIKSGARVGPYCVIGRHVHIEEVARLDDAIVWANSWIGRDAEVTGAILGRNCHVGRSAVIRPDAILGDKRVVTDFSRA